MQASGEVTGTNVVDTASLNLGWPLARAQLLISKEFVKGYEISHQSLEDIQIVLLYIC